MMKIIISGNDITFIGFKDGNREVTPEEAKIFLWDFYARATKIINNTIPVDTIK